MPRKLLQRLLPDVEKLRARSGLRPVTRLLESPHYFHLTRRSASNGLAVGLFCAFVPIPFQMVLAVVLSALGRANIPMALTAVWITNPITLPLFIYLAYNLGAALLGQSPGTPEGAQGWGDPISLITDLGRPFLLGCAILSILAGATGYIGAQLLWRWAVLHRWRSRQRH